MITRTDSPPFSFGRRTRRLFLAPTIVTAGLLMAAQPALLHAEPLFALTPQGLVVRADEMGDFKLPPPKVGVTGGGNEKPAYELVSSDLAMVRYPGGMTLEYKLAADHKKVGFHFTGGQDRTRTIQFEMYVPMRFNLGGYYAMNGEAAKLIPPQKAQQFVEQGNGSLFSLWNPAGAGFTLVTPGGWQGLQDNRVFDWEVYVYLYNFDLQHRDEGHFELSVEPAPPPGAPPQPKTRASATPGTPSVTAPARMLVDRYGQSTRVNYPGKVTSDDELKRDAATEAASILSPDGPALDRFGGLDGTREALNLEATGFFHLASAGGRQTLVTPEGNLFFHLGVCGLSNTDDYTQVQGREKNFEWVPSHAGEFATAWRPHTPGAFSFYIANWIRKHGRPFSFEEWSRQFVPRLRSWGFNSGGAFSGYSESMRAAHFPYVSMLPNGGNRGLKMLPGNVGASPVMDPFEPANEERLDRLFAEIVAPKATDPLLIGYFIGNEQHFESLPKLLPAYKGTVASKRRLVQALEAKYRTIEAFNAAWNPARPVARFTDLADETLFVRTDAAAADMQAFYETFMEAYHEMMHRLFRKHDPHHLLLGSRLTPGTSSNETAVRISAKYTDVVSVNYYTYAIEKDFLDRVHRWSGGRPLVLSEWYFSARDQGLGAHKEVADQHERGLGYRHYVEQAAALPYVVGSEWFIYTDQSITGRFFEGFNGEGNNTGLINVVDRPYNDLVSACQLTHSRIYDVMQGREKPFSFDDSRFTSVSGGVRHKVVAVPRALPGLAIDGTTNHWPGRPAETIDGRGLVLGNPSPNFRADFRLCWDDRHLYLFIQVKDEIPMRNKRQPAALWSADGVELFIGTRNLDQGGTMQFTDRQILLGATAPAQVYVNDHPEAGKECRAVAVKDVSGDGYVIEAAIPWRLLGGTPAEGAELLFDIGVDNSDDGLSRKQQLMWNGTARNSGERDRWGRARLVRN